MCLLHLPSRQLQSSMSGIIYVCTVTVHRRSPHFISRWNKSRIKTWYNVLETMPATVNTCMFRNWLLQKTSMQPLPRPAQFSISHIYTWHGHQVDSILADPNSWPSCELLPPRGWCWIRTTTDWRFHLLILTPSHPSRKHKEFEIFHKLHRT